MPVNVSKQVQENINTLEKMTFETLKDFQKKTVERVSSLFENNQNRVLVADEVGMGKTMVAKGVIAKLAQTRIKEGDDLFKVIYICSNQAIAKQNIKTLDIVSMLPQYSKEPLTDTSDTRLSMQHLKITQQENDKHLKEKFIQIIPLTPGTSFEMSQGCGNINERALIFAIIKRIKELKNYLKDLEKICILDATTNGYAVLQEYEQKVEQTEKQSKRKYPKNIIEELRNVVITIDETEISLIEYAKKVAKLRKKRNCTKASRCSKCEYYNDCKRLLTEFRINLAQISTRNLNPDLVIMDEFQRFNTLIDENNQEDSGILARMFLEENAEDLDKKTRVLLLSATPYKLYSTMEEIDECSEEDNPYNEFYKVMFFLFNKEKEKFRNTWEEYSKCLQNAQKHGFTVLKTKKLLAEDAMYKGTCRTERLSVMSDGDFIDDSSKNEHLKITKNDILSFMQMQTIVNMCGAERNIPTDYVKSCPYLMSFMENYILKKKIKQKFVEGEDTKILKKPLVWLDKNIIENYGELPQTNSRLTLLEQKAFENNAEKLLWVPPCKPYYELKGAYEGVTDFSKILVFSSWEMVPRMISTLVSYEAERRIYGNKYAYSDSDETKQNKPEPRLRFALKGKEPNSMNLFTLVYPSKTLASLFNPVETLNNHISLSQLELNIKEQIKLKLNKLKKYENQEVLGNRKYINRWYFLAPILMDGIKYSQSWLAELLVEYEGRKEEDNDRYSVYLKTLDSILSNEIVLGKMPDDLADYLTLATLGSFAVCYYRACKNYENAQKNSTLFARSFINNFNAPEIITIVDSIYGNKRDYLLNVLQYSKDGCFQGMLDEYIHLLQKNNNGSFQTDLIQNLDMLQTSHYEIDTLKAFETEIINKQREQNAKRNETPNLLNVRNKKINMRTHFAVCFSKSTDKNDNGDRKENLRNAFNSPLRPFVLASTSIGQEGLDFHNYCRKIMHWNLPSNPIDLEQREGRINRYKCLAIRQNVAEKYGNSTFQKDIWNEMFQKAEQGERQHGQSELIPYWCFGKNQKIKIERIVPIYPMSSDINRYERLIKILSLYRMTLGQPRQEELLEYIFSNFSEEEQQEMKGLFINLSPFSKEK